MVVRGKNQVIPGLKTTFELNLCVCGEPVTGQGFIFCQGCGSIKYRAVKEAVFRHYGQECVCCGATEDLAIDHMDGSGKEHREADALARSNLCAWLVGNNYPPGFQPLCRRCNSSKHRGDTCRIHGKYLGEVVTVSINVSGWEALAA